MKGALLPQQDQLTSKKSPFSKENELKILNIDSQSLSKPTNTERNESPRVVPFMLQVDTTKGKVFNTFSNIYTSQSGNNTARTSEII